MSATLTKIEVLFDAFGVIQTFTEELPFLALK
ncbi:hypothetical protein NS506_00765 [Nocardia seriolae]|uniref:Hydrolase n=1 Tax=Nocardia seriolae TaxID=37332 RepID=A0ABC8AL38_9NOCA|nr:hypothetical protein NS506_00765 [Nocardia seriolae]